MIYWIKGLKIIVDIIYKPNNKNLYYSFKYPNVVIIKTNKYTNNEKYINEKLIPSIQDWIVSQYFKYQNLAEEYNLEEGLDDKHIHILGKKYDLKIYKTDRDLVLQNNNEVTVITKKEDIKHVQNLVDTLYNDNLKQIVANHIEGIKERFNIKFDIKFEYKRAKSFFGKCYFNERRIVLASFLAKYELKYILSVIYHEVGHFYVHNHQDEFYKLLDEVFPDYRQTQKELRKIKYLEKF